MEIVAAVVTICLNVRYNKPYKGGFKHTMKEKLRKSIIQMLASINDVRALERIHRFVEYIYTGK